MKVLVTGSNGQLGSELKQLAKSNTDLTFIFTDVDELDICNTEEVNSFIAKHQPQYIVNCAAYTAVDKAEEESDKAFLINAKAVEILSKAASHNNASIIHISTDYVFDGSSDIPYKETDQTNPNSAYGRSKLAGEKAIESYAVNGAIIRTAWLYSEFGNNFVKTMLNLSKKFSELKVVSDQIGSPTYANDLAKAVLQIIHKNDLNGVHYYHYSNEGSCSWYDFAQSIFKHKGISIKVHAIPTVEYPTPAKRPAFSLLNKSKIKRDYAIEVPHWEDQLIACLKNL